MHAHFLAEALNERVDQQGQILGAFAQRRQPHAEDIEPPIEILAELPRTNAAFEVLVRRRDHPHVELQRTPRAEARDFAVLQDPQQLGLRVEWKVADFVEEQRSPIRLFELAGSRFLGVGKSAALVAEELRLDEGRGNGAAVDRDEWPGTARAALVNRPRDEFFPVPDSPRIRTVASLSARRVMMRNTSCIARLIPTMLSNPYRADSSRRSSSTSRDRRRSSRERLTVTSRSSLSNGFVR